MHLWNKKSGYYRLMESGPITASLKEKLPLYNNMWTPQAVLRVRVWVSGIEGFRWTIKFPKMYMQSEISPCRVGFVSVMLIMSSQVEPLNPGAHIHSNELGELLHVPPLRQGLERHMFKSFSQFLPCLNTTQPMKSRKLGKNFNRYGIHCSHVDMYTGSYSRGCCS